MYDVLINHRVCRQMKKSIHKFERLPDRCWTTNTHMHEFELLTPDFSAVYMHVLNKNDQIFIASSNLSRRERWDFTLYKKRTFDFFFIVLVRSFVGGGQAENLILAMLLFSETIWWKHLAKQFNISVYCSVLY